jgi:P27 family predicted phage terminase small subunit
MKRRLPAPPSHLSNAAKTWWRAVVLDFELADHPRMQLQAACEAWDRMQGARHILAAEVITFRDDRGNPRSHPAVSIEKDARIAFLRALRELDLDAGEPSEAPRPPGLRSNRGSERCRRSGERAKRETFRRSGG